MKPRVSNASEWRQPSMPSPRHIVRQFLSPKIFLLRGQFIVGSLAKTNLLTRNTCMQQPLAYILQRLFPLEIQLDFYVRPIFFNSHE
jgi:hypothetical protein